MDNIWGKDLADIKLISKFNKGLRFFLFVINIYSKYTWVIPLKDKTEVTTTNTFQEILDESNRNPKKIWVDKGSEFYNRSMKSFLQNNDIEIYSSHNERKSVIAERFTRNLKNKIYKCMNPVSKNVYINKLDDTVIEYNYTYYKSKHIFWL